MLEYRIFTFNRDNHIAGATLIERESDEEAIDAAKALLAGLDVELWQAARRVIRLQSTEK